jgi:prefoldin subunit 5
MEPEIERTFRQLERTQERHATLIEELQRRMDAVETMRNDLRRVEQALTRLEGRLEAVLAKMQTWQNLVWVLLIMLISGVVAAGFELFRR